MNEMPLHKVLGSMGRNGDDMVAHLRRGGEMVVPLDAPESFGQTVATFAKEIAAYNKKMERKNATGMKQSAETLEPFTPQPMLDIRDFIAGFKTPERTNPQTGAEEYFSIASTGKQGGGGQRGGGAGSFLRANGNTPGKSIAPQPLDGGQTPEMASKRTKPLMVSFLGNTPAGQWFNLR